MIVALHGFLGGPADWSFLRREYDVFAPALFEFQSLQNKLGFNGFVEELDQLLAGAEEKILLGYSLGGRLGLHSLFEGNTRYKAVIFVSTHFGLSFEDEKNVRLKNDKDWATKFLNNSWQTLMQEWQGQAVFKTSDLKSTHTESLVRNESDFDRQALHNSLEYWSLAHQNCFLEKLNSLKVPCFWITGDEDAKFVTIANQIQNNEKFFYKVNIKNAGHRVPWQNQKEFLTQIRQFLNVVSAL